jgi:NADH-quinone oxidoreductase subunit L
MTMDPVLLAPLLAATEGTAEATSGGIYDTLLPLIPLLPILGFLFTAAIGRRLGKRAHIVPVGLVIASWVAAMVVVYAALTGQTPFGEHGYGVTLWRWIPAGPDAQTGFNVDVGLFVDNLTACLLIVVTTIGMLVHVYSIGYMAHDAGYWRFFAYLNLFMFSMLLLVMADSWLVVFVAWELVGLSSYLLIGFWYRKRSAALAAKKAFLVNRVGDVGFALGIMAIFVSLGTLDMRETFARIGELPAGTITLIALLLFCGAVGKSAQFPLHVWLPDAMEGPTPVSALIHAATMVNAGVYLVARANLIFSHAPEAMIVVAAIGIFTAILAASIAFTQTDIKRVLAYSTLSQLGYMFAALGVGAYVAAIFHLMTHGFFKGLLFLGSGSVIHAVHEEQDMRQMGGLAAKIKWTYATMLVGSLAIAGIPPLAGFFSKDEILGEAFKFGMYWVWIVGVIVAVMTAFYMFRLMGMTFWGSFRGPKAIWEKVHESPAVMVVPLVLLAIASALLGMLLGLPLGDSTIAHWLEPVFVESEELLGHAGAEYALFGIDGVLILISVTVAVVGMVLAWWLFGIRWLVFRRDPRPERVHAIAEANAVSRFLYRASLNKWWFDDLNHLLFIVIGGRVADSFWWFDRVVVDGTVNGLGGAVSGAGRALRQVQTGRVQNYALGIALGLLVMAGSYLIIVQR